MISPSYLFVTHRSTPITSPVRTQLQFDVEDPKPAKESGEDQTMTSSMPSCLSFIRIGRALNCRWRKNCRGSPYVDLPHQDQPGSHLQRPYVKQFLIWALIIILFVTFFFLILYHNHGVYFQGDAGTVVRRKALNMLGSGHRHQRSRLGKISLKQGADSKEVSTNGLPVWPHITKLRDEVYYNLTHFTESYKAMEKSLKIYVYPDGYKPLVHEARTKGIYATEGLFLKRIEKPGNRFTVADPSKAHMFLLPYSVRQMVDHLQDPYTRSMRTLKTFIADYVRTIATKYPYWNRTHGADHFFVSCHDWAPLSTQNHVELHRNAMKVVCNADLTMNFDVHKDVSIPQTLVGGIQSHLDVGNLGPDERDFLAFYAGQMHGRVRPMLINHWKGKDPDMRVYELLPKSIAENISYAQHMKRSKFCLCPKGFEVNSPRIVEAILNGCVPVIISDNFVLPYSDVLDWSKFSITVPEKNIPDLKKFLTSVPNETYRSMQRRLKYVRRHFVWLEEPEDTSYDSFHMTLHSIWRQSLNLHKRFSKNGKGLPLRKIVS